MSSLYSLMSMIAMNNSSYQPLNFQLLAHESFLLVTEESFFHRNLIIHRMLMWSWFTFWLLQQWRYNQVQTFVLHRYQLSFPIECCGLILFSDF
jgi:hypothetical protein